MARVETSLIHRTSMDYAPLAVLGYALRKAGVLEALQSIEMPIKSYSHRPGDKVIEGLALILTGGRATSQADLLLRPNRLLARAWGQDEFAQQSTLADTLDAFDTSSVNRLREIFEEMVATWSASCQHDFRTGLLVVDEDLTGLPASRRAEGSTQGYFAGEKTESVAKWRGSRSAPTARPSVRWCTLVLPIVCRRFSQAFCWPSGC